MVTFDPVVLVLAGVVHGGRDQVLDHVRQRRRPVGYHLVRFIVIASGPRRSTGGGGDVALVRDSNTSMT